MKPHIKAIRDMYAALSETDAPFLHEALCTVVDCIDMELIPPEVLVEVMLGKRTIADAMASLHEVMVGADEYCDEGDDDDFLRADVAAAAQTLNFAVPETSTP